MQPPRSAIDGSGRIRHPARRGKRIALEAVSLPRASKSSRRAGKRQKALRRLLCRPERHSAERKRGKAERLATSTQITRAQWLGPRQQVESNDSGKRAAKDNVPVEQIETQEAQIAARDPPDARCQCHSHCKQSQRAQHRATI